MKPNAEYERVYHELWDVMRAWIKAHATTGVVFCFPENGVIFGELGELPEACIGNDGARELWKHCAAHCPDATCLMFQDLIERVTAAAVEHGVGIMNRSTLGDA